MSDPMNNRPIETPPPEAEPRKSASPLIWILLLIALIAFGWYFYNRSHESAATSPDLLPPPATSDAMTPGANGSTEPVTKKAAPKPAKPAIAKVERRDSEVALLTDPKPAYPPEAFRAGEEGTVTVMASVDAQGDVSGVEIADRSGSRTLDRAALNEVRRWKFTPAMKDGKTVASTIKVPVDYKLADGKQ